MTEHILTTTVYSYMISEVTHGIKVIVETFYHREHSDVRINQFMFAYRITIENESEYAIKLLRRHWFIFDSVGEHKEVEGDGVVGKQPVIQPGEHHQYVSGCNLKSEMGTMRGTYQMQRLADGKLFDVVIPEFTLITPEKLN
jgi:ApaG protein